jgi:hypothetical protein
MAHPEAAGQLPAGLLVSLLSIHGSDDAIVSGG